MSLKARAACAASVVALGTLLSTPAGAYSLLGYTWIQPSVPYYINPTNLDVPASAIEPAVQAGANAWAAQSGASFAFSFAGLTTRTTNTNDGVNVVMFRNAASGSALATAYSWFSGGRIIDADIVFWDGSYRFVTGSTGCSGAFFIEDVAAHEFGHALGLGHSTVTGATMYPSIATCSTQSRSLSADDIAAIRSIYPPTGPIPITPPAALRIVR